MKARAVAVGQERQEAPLERPGVQIKNKFQAAENDSGAHTKKKEEQ